MIFRVINFGTKYASSESSLFDNYNGVNFIEKDFALFEIMRKNEMYCAVKRYLLLFSSILNEFYAAIEMSSFVNMIAVNQTWRILGFNNLNLLKEVLMREKIDKI